MRPSTLRVASRAVSVTAALLNPRRLLTFMQGRGGAIRGERRERDPFPFCGEEGITLSLQCAPTFGLSMESVLKTNREITATSAFLSSKMHKHAFPARGSAQNPTGGAFSAFKIP